MWTDGSSVIFSIFFCNQDVNTVELDFKNRQDKNQLGFKNKITNDQIGQISFKNLEDKKNLTLRTKMAVTKNVLKVKFDCTSEFLCSKKTQNICLKSVLQFTKLC